MPPVPSTASWDEWRQAALKSLEDVVTTTLGLPAPVHRGTATEAPHNLNGSFLPLVGHEQSAQVALLASPAHCEAMARQLFGVAPNAPCPPRDVVDAVGELANQLAGGVQRRLGSKLGDLELGLPIFIEGYVRTGSTVTVSVDHVRTRDLDLAVLIVRESRPER